METCFSCKGSGSNILHVRDFTSGEKIEENMEIVCVHCDVAGEVKTEYRQAWDEHKRDWCECGYNFGTLFYPDGKHPKCWGHHYRCKRCGKITQIG